MKVLVTGHQGYIGAHLVDVLKEYGHHVTGVDLNLFEGCAWGKVTPADREVVKDVRDLEAKDLAGFGAIMHLAAISNDPMGEIDSSLTYDINRNASIRIAKLARQAGVPKFLFAGSCSVYGAGSDAPVDESGTLAPLTAYARSKVEAEAAILAMADDSFSPVSLRNSTAYGDSPMLRIDLVVNNLLGSALSYGEIRINSDGTPWRPLIHCRDIARAFVAMAHAPRIAVHAKAINVGGNAENYRVRDVGSQVKRLIPMADVVYTGQTGADPRNYRVNFDLLGRLLPEFQLSYNLATGMQELHRAMVDRKFSKTDFEGAKFVRLRTLQKRMEKLKSRAVA